MLLLPVSGFHYGNHVSEWGIISVDKRLLDVLKHEWCSSFEYHFDERVFLQICRWKSINKRRTSF